MAEGLAILTFGSLQILRDGAPVTGLASRKAEALIVYLACASGPQAREVLADLLWDELPAARARGNLSVQLNGRPHPIDNYHFLCILLLCLVKAPPPLSGFPLPKLNLILSRTSPALRCSTAFHVWHDESPAIRQSAALFDIVASVFDLSSSGHHELPASTVNPEDDHDGQHGNHPDFTGCRRQDI